MSCYWQDQENINVDCWAVIVYPILETVKCQVKCKRCGEYTFEREVGNHEEGKKLALRLCRGEEKCQNEDCNKKLKVMDREAFKQEWDIVEQ